MHNKLSFHDDITFYFNTYMNINLKGNKFIIYILLLYIYYVNDNYRSIRHRLSHFRVIKIYLTYE